MAFVLLFPVQNSLRLAQFVSVDWDESVNSGFSLGDLDEHVKPLLKGLSVAVGVWCNVTGELSCNSLQDCAVGRRRELKKEEEEEEEEEAKAAVSGTCSVDISVDENFNCWEPMNCNDNLNLPNCLAQGIGNDVFWPPTVDRNTTLETFLGPKGELGEGCKMEDGLFGYPTQGDAWSFFMDSEYGGLRIDGFSNVVFSNGYYDPWMSAGVFDHEYVVGGDMVQKLNEEGNMISLVLDQGAHHLDLFFR